MAVTSRKTGFIVAGVLVLVLVLGVALGAAILRSGKGGAVKDEHGHGHAEHPAGSADDKHHAKASTGAHADAERHGDQADHSEPAFTKGPHGGRLFSKGSFALELTIYETDVEPQFRVYLYRDGKPIAPTQAQVGVTLQRLGRAPETFSFAVEKDYLKGSAVVAEPHSFEATVKAQVGTELHEFRFEQVEVRVTFTDEQLKRHGVEVAVAGSASIRSGLQLLGEVTLNQDRSVHVTPRLSGLVEAVRANAGDRVRKGQVLAVISSQALADQRSELLAAQKRLGLARTTLEREKKLWEEKVTAEQDLLAARQAFHEAEITAEAARQKLISLGAGGSVSTQGLTRFEIRSPIDGTVTDKKISVGEVVKEDALVFQVADLSTVWIELMVPAKDVARLKVGDVARIKSASFDTLGSARLSHVGALVGEQSRQAGARLVLANADGIWRPGLPVTVDLSSGEVTVPVAVSVEAVQSLRDWTVVFGRYGTQFEARPVKLGRSDGRVVEVIEGLQAGERYAAKNSFLIKADIGKAGASHDH